MKNLQSNDLNASIDDWLNKLSYIRTMVYQGAMDKNEVHFYVIICPGRATKGIAERIC